MVSPETFVSKSCSAATVTSPLMRAATRPIASMIIVVGIALAGSVPRKPAIIESSTSVG